jgi:elongator complex protein 1
MDPVYMKYKIHIDLKQYEKAVKMLVPGGEKYFEEALSVIKKHRLFKQAMLYYQEQPELVRKVKLSFGEYLEQRGYSEEAGFLYNGAGEI